MSDAEPPRQRLRPDARNDGEGLADASQTAARVNGFDWAAIEAELDREGHAVIAPFLSPATCNAIAGFYTSARFRSTIDMARYNFGSGQYKYFSYPLPPEVQALRDAFYPPLARIANGWAERLGKAETWPPSLGEFTRVCHAAGQDKPTPLLLRYGQDDFNCLHQDLYGPIHFPLQIIVQLSVPGADFGGGELILVEQRPRMQSRPMVVPMEQGGAAIVPVRDRPCRGRKGDHRVQMRHGVSRVTRGVRTTLGLIFHDAQ